MSSRGRGRPPGRRGRRADAAEPLVLDRSKRARLHTTRWPVSIYSDAEGCRRASVKDKEDQVSPCHCTLVPVKLEATCCSSSCLRSSSGEYWRCEVQVVDMGSFVDEDLAVREYDRAAEGTDKTGDLDIPSRARSSHLHEGEQGSLSAAAADSGA